MYIYVMNYLLSRVVQRFQFEQSVYIESVARVDVDPRLKIRLINTENDVYKVSFNDSFYLFLLTVFTINLSS